VKAAVMDQSGEPKLSAAEFRRRRRGRNLALLFVLVGLCVLFFAITILKRAGTG
jgi:hypothetical protein